MGEASRKRKAQLSSEQSSGSAKHRGLVLSPHVDIDGNRLKMSVNSSNRLDAVELRFALLFWDSLVWPSSKAIHFGSGRDEQFLESAGILSRPDYTFRGDFATGLVHAQLQAFEDLDIKEPGCWALAQGDDLFKWKNGTDANMRGASVELFRAIPIPRHDVPISEVLEFRLRRRDELTLTRQYVESLVDAIEKATEPQIELQKRVDEIDQACADLLAVGKEWQFPVCLSNLKASFNLSPTKFLPSVAGGWKLGEPYGLTAAAAVASGAGIASTIEIKADFGIRSVRRPQNPFRYAFLAHEELR